MNPGDEVKRATVIETVDPLGLGRVLIRFSDGVTETEVWARVAIPQQGSRGATAQFEMSDEVLVSFAHGDLRSPIVIGTLWQGGATPPTQADTKPQRRPIVPLVKPQKEK